MKSINRKALAVGAVAAFAGAALVGPSIALAKSYKTNFVTKSTGAKSTPQGLSFTGVYKGKPIGTCKVTGVLIIPKSISTLKCKGGSFKVVATGKGAVDVTGTWKASAGKGKYKGIKGGGKFSGSTATNVFTYKGTLKY